MQSIMPALNLLFLMTLLAFASVDAIKCKAGVGNSASDIASEIECQYINCYTLALGEGVFKKGCGHCDGQDMKCFNCEGNLCNAAPAPAPAASGVRPPHSTPSNGTFLWIWTLLAIFCASLLFRQL